MAIISKETAICQNESDPHGCPWASRSRETKSATDEPISNDARMSGVSG